MRKKADQKLSQLIASQRRVREIREKREEQKREARIARENKLRKEASALFGRLDCDAFAKTDPAFRSGYTIEECETLAVNKRIREAVTARDCDLAREIEAEHDRNGEQSQSCERLARKEKLLSVYSDSLDKGECETIQSIEDELKITPKRAQDCLDERAYRKAEGAFTEAVANYDCRAAQQIVTDQLDLDRGYPTAGWLDQCLIGKAQSANSARQVFLAAAKFDAKGKTAAALLLYEDIVDRFPDDDLALDSVKRMTKINDIQQAAQRQVKMEEEMVRLRRDAEEAQRKAEATRQAAAIPNFPGGFRPGDKAYLCFKGGGTKQVTIVQNPPGEQMLVRIEEYFATGGFFNLSEYHVGENHYFSRYGTVHLRGDCNS